MYIDISLIIIQDNFCYEKVDSEWWQFYFVLYSIKLLKLFIICIIVVLYSSKITYLAALLWEDRQI